MTELDSATREAVLSHVLDEVHPDRLDAEIVGRAPLGEQMVVGVKVHPRGYLSTAKYALVTLDAEGGILEAESCTGRELRREIGA